MRRIRLPGLDIETSVIGFGCASLGSRVSPRSGLTALARAHEAGVTWFDLAPAYGAGEAETIFADFLKTRRDRVQVLTKVGLVPPAQSELLRASYAVLRPIAGAMGGLRRIAKKTAITRNQTVPITAALIEDSIATSLRRLRTDHVDVLALHDPDPDAVLRDDVLRALERVAARGQARGIGIAGPREACLAGARAGLPYRLFQTAVDADGATFATIRRDAGRPVATIGHSVMRSDGHAPDSAAQLRAALATNPAGVTLLSMFDPAHLAANLAVVHEAAPAAGHDLDLAS